MLGSGSSGFPGAVLAEYSGLGIRFDSGNRLRREGRFSAGMCVQGLAVSVSLVVDCLCGGYHHDFRADAARAILFGIVSPFSCI